MDAKANESSPGMSLPPRRSTVPPQVQEQEHLSQEHLSRAIEASTPLDRAVACQVAWALTCIGEGRDAKIRELQDAVKSGTYHVPAEQIAGKMLQDTLHELI
jgi:anti-sigma28 factor (negative regulator of flagellin synthesis)